MTPDEIITALDLKPHPEGGFYRETFRDYAGPDGRACSTAIYYLLRAGEVSRWHRIDAAEIWLSSLEAGGPVPLTQAPVAYEALAIEEIEKRHIVRTLEHTDWNKTQAAGILGIERSTLDRKIKAYDLKR